MLAEFDEEKMAKHIYDQYVEKLSPYDTADSKIAEHLEELYGPFSGNKADGSTTDAEPEETKDGFEEESMWQPIPEGGDAAGNQGGKQNKGQSQKQTRQKEGGNKQ